MASVRNDELGKTAISCIACEDWVLAKVLSIVKTIAAMAAGLAEPRNSNPLTNREVANSFAQRTYLSDDFVTEDQRKFRTRELAINNVKIRSTKGAGLNLYPQLS
jgi:hypothetical protein